MSENGTVTTDHLSREELVGALAFYQPRAHALARECGELRAKIKKLRRAGYWSRLWWAIKGGK